MKKNNLQMILPSNCKVMGINEMLIADGGTTIAYEPSFCTIDGATAKAQSLIQENGWTNISVKDLSAEIWCHSFAYYKGGPMVDIMKKLGLDVTGTSVWQSVSNGIDVIDGLDTATVGGVPRHAIYKACFDMYSSMPFAQ